MTGFLGTKELCYQTTYQSTKRKPNGKTINMNQGETTRDELQYPSRRQLPGGRMKLSP